MTKSALTKKRILRSARKLFLAKGYEHVTIREIAIKAQCSHTSIYYYFENKFEILEEIVRIPLKKLYKDLEAIMLEDLAATEKVRKMSAIYVEFGVQNRDYYDLFMTYENIRIDTEQIEVEQDERRAEVLTLFYQVISEITTKEKTDEYNALDVSKGIFYALHGIVMTYIKTPNGYGYMKERMNTILDHYFIFMFRSREAL